MKLHKQQLYL